VPLPLKTPGYAIVEAMPEGDTIHRAASEIAAALEGRVPEEILTPHPRHLMDRWPERLGGRRVRSVDAHGKHLFVRFDGGLTLHSHLRMSGMWGVYGRGQRWRRATRRAWLVLRSQDVEVVEFDGPVLELMSDARARSDARFASLGPDVLGESFDVPTFLARLRAGECDRAIGDALLDQHVVAGIGNLWKAELCFATGLDPWRPVARVGDGEAIAVVELGRELMRRAVSGGHRARPGEVYRRAGRECRRCGTIIRSRGQGENNRTTYWCPGCQS
jgi:endonuclease-8